MAGNFISRTDAEALIPQEYSQEIIKAVPQQSAVMRMGRRLRNMSRSQMRMPVLNGLVTAYFVNGDTGWKQTSKALWQNKFIDAAELAVIVPIPEAVIDDAEYDIEAEIQPQIVEAFAAAFDQAVLLGTNAPSIWPQAVLPGAAAAGSVVTLGAGADIYEDICGEGGVLSKVEDDGYDVTGHIAALRLKAKLRGLRGSDGQPIFSRTPQAATPYELDGVGLDFPKNGAIDPAQALLISGDFQQLVYAVRSDVTYKVLTEATIHDPVTGDVLYNLAQQDMVALRATMRLGWQLPNPVNRVNTNSATRCPFAALLPAG